MCPKLKCNDITFMYSTHYYPTGTFNDRPHILPVSPATDGPEINTHTYVHGADDVKTDKFN